MERLRIILLTASLTLLTVILCGWEKPDYEGGSSNATVEITEISVGTKDKAGRYTVKITVRAKNLSSGESVRMIGAKWGTVKNNPNSRDSRSGVSSATFTSAWHTGTTYYVTPFIKTNMTSGEIDGNTVTKRTP